MTFTPKFVDLVRNFTTSTGTGPVALSTAVSGYTGIAEALSAGDQFYYCIQGVDKPAEREVGRGALLAGGKVSREPISGALVNFTTGTKTIALVAAAEWFAKLESGAGKSKSPFATPQDFGAKGDGIADDTAAFEAALDFLDQNRAGYNGAQRLWIPIGTYKLTRALNIRATLVIEGESRLGTKLQWSGTSCGFITQGPNTADGVSGAAPLWSVGGATFASIRNMTLDGGFTGAEGALHGVAVRWRGHLADLDLVNWGGNGIHSEASAGGGASEGNANCSKVERCSASHCTNGMFTDGADTNAWLIEGCDFSSNRQWGVWDSSFLGNTYIGCHAAANGWDGALWSTATACTFGGNRYYVKTGQAAWCSANPPSSTNADNQGWGFVGPGGTYNGIVDWASGTAFREGGSYKTDDPNARNLFVGCYSEGDQNPARLISPTFVLSGAQAAGMTGTMGELQAYNGGVRGNRFVFVTQATGYFVGMDSVAGLDFNGEFQLRKVGTDYAWTPFYADGTEHQAFRLTGPGTPSGIGQRRLDFPNGFGLADKKVLSGSTAPVAGNYIRGDMLLNDAPSAGGPMGWMCVEAGSPGTWKAMASLAA